MPCHSAWPLQHERRRDKERLLLDLWLRSTERYAFLDLLGELAKALLLLSHLNAQALTFQSVRGLCAQLETTQALATRGPSIRTRDAPEVTRQDRSVGGVHFQQRTILVVPAPFS